MTRTVRNAALGAAAACLAWAGVAFGQSNTSGMTGGTSTATPESAPKRGNTPSTGGGSTTQTGKASSSDTSTSAGTGTGSSATAQAGHVAGQVDKFDRKDKTISLKDSDKKLKVDSSTDVTKDGARASINDIKEGDQVRASFTGSGEKVNASHIEITSSGKSGKSSKSSDKSSSSSSSSDTSSPKSPSPSGSSKSY